MKNIAIFASGNGSNFEAIVDACRRGEIEAEPVVCVCDKPGAGVIDRAKRLGVPAVVASPREFDSRRDYEKYLADQLKSLDVDLICLAGYMRLVGEVLLEAFPDRILNIHPSLLPDFKGAHAIKDAFDAGTNRYGVTVHYVDETLDGGPIIVQRKVDYNGPSLEDLEAEVHKVEHILYPEAIRMAMSRLIN